MPKIYVANGFWDPQVDESIELGSAEYWEMMKTAYPHILQYSIGDRILFSHDGEEATADTQPNDNNEDSNTSDHQKIDGNDTVPSSSSSSSSTGPLVSEMTRQQMRYSQELLDSHSRSSGWAWGYRMDRYGLINWAACESFPRVHCTIDVDTPEEYARVHKQGCLAETVLKQALCRWPDLPFLGEHTNPNPNPTLPTSSWEEDERERIFFDHVPKPEELDSAADSGFRWMTYGRVASCAMALMRALRDSCLLPARAAVGICGVNSVEWVLADLACLFGSFISVPLYCRSEDHVFEYIVRQAGLKLIFCDAFHHALFTRLYPDHSQRPILVRFGPTTDHRGPFVAQLVSDHLTELNDDWIETPKSEILTLMYTRYVQIKQISNMCFVLSLNITHFGIFL